MDTRLQPPLQSPDVYSSVPTQGYHQAEVQPTMLFPVPHRESYQNKEVGDIPQFNRLTNTFAQPLHLIGKRGGWKALLLLCNSLILGGAAVFALRAQTHPIIFRLESLSGRIVNSSNLSALISACGSILAAIFAYSMVIVGRLWLLERLHRRQEVTLGAWQAIASKGTFDDLPYAFTIGGSTFVIALAITWYIPTSLSGALIPTLKTVTEDLPSSEHFFAIAGSGGNATLSSDGSCFQDGVTCPAQIYFGDMYQAMQYSLGGYGGYYQSWGVSPNTTPPVPVQIGLSNIWSSVPKSRLISYSSYASSTACLPITIPQVTCQIVSNPSGVSINGGQISYPSACGVITLGSTSSDGGTYTNACENTATNVFELTHTISENAGSSVWQSACNITVLEEMHLLTFYAGDQSVFIDEGRCAGAGKALSLAEMRGLTSSVTFLIASADNSTAGVGSVRPPLNKEIADAVKQGKVVQYQNMIAAGINTAATIVYELGYQQAINTFTFDGSIRYSAYTWGGGFKGYVWATLLIVATLFGVVVSVLGLIKPRLAYDPTNYSQTVLMASGHHTNDAKKKSLKMTLEESQSGELTLSIF